MKFGKSKYLVFILSILFFNSILNSEEKIVTVPLVNLEQLKPSYDNVEKNETVNQAEKIESLKEKDQKILSHKNITINILGLDKITAKTSEIKIKIGETKKFGLLQIKGIKCGKTNSINEPGEAAYIQVKDISDNRNEKIFVFNGWTFSSSPSLRPIDHPVYDLWLLGCDNV
jgi:hypothetical protein